MSDKDRPVLAQSLKKIEDAIQQAIAAFSAAHPEKCAPFLAAGLKETQNLIEQVRHSELSKDEKYNVLHELEIKRVQFNNVLVQSLGIAIRAVVQPDHEVNPLFAMFVGDPDTFRLAIPGQSFGVRVSVTNQTAEKVNLSRVYLEGPPGGRELVDH